MYLSFINSVCSASELFILPVTLLVSVINNYVNIKQLTASSRETELCSQVVSILAVYSGGLWFRSRPEDNLYCSTFS
jgi:hypothetical protein